MTVHSLCHNCSTHTHTHTHTAAPKPPSATAGGWGGGTASSVLTRPVILTSGPEVSSPCHKRIRVPRIKVPEASSKSNIYNLEVMPNEERQKENSSSSSEEEKPGPDVDAGHAPEAKAACASIQIKNVPLNVGEVWRECGSTGVATANLHPICSPEKIRLWKSAQQRTGVRATTLFRTLGR